MRSAARLSTPIGRLLMEVSCSIWGKSTEVRCCLKTVWDNSVGSISSMCALRHNQISTVSLVWVRHSSPRTLRWGHLPGQTTAEASGRSGQRSGNRAATSSELAAREPLDDSPLPNCPDQDVVQTDRDNQLLPDLRWASAMALPRCVVSIRLGLGRKSRSCHEGSSVLGLALELAVESGQINALTGLVLGQQNSGPLRRTAGKTKPQTDEQRGKRACALTARGSISKATKGLVGGAAQGPVDCRRNGTTNLIRRSSNSSHQSASRHPELPGVEGETNWCGGR